MIKKIVIAGCRDFNDYDIAQKYIDLCVKDIKEKYEIVFITGGCKGADSLGQRYAKENGYKTEIFPADWKSYGKAAGPKRNKQIAEICDLVICFWDEKSRGTKSMIDYAKQYNKPVKIKII